MFEKALELLEEKKFGQLKSFLAELNPADIALFMEEIPKESIGKIFNKFYQADESHAAEGNGVGLAIVRKIVELHKGNISVKSENGITSFEIEL